MPTPASKQHTDLFRKLLLRKRLCPNTRGSAYVPFIGDADVAAQLYSGCAVYGADLDPVRIELARTRLPGAVLKVADCEVWPLPEIDAPFSLADFDSYSYPYGSFRAFWSHANKAPRLTLFFTDGQRIQFMRRRTLKHPAGEILRYENLTERRKTYNFWMKRVVLPWFTEYIKPWKIVRQMSYLRGVGMVYWGCVLTNEG